MKKSNSSKVFRWLPVHQRTRPTEEFLILNDDIKEATFTILGEVIDNPWYKLRIRSHDEPESRWYDLIPPDVAKEMKKFISELHS